MAIHYRSPGLILSKDDIWEADQVFSIYTKDFGKLKILGRAIRKIKSKLRSGARLFYLSEIEFIQGKNYKTLTDALVIEKFKDIRNDLEKLEIAYQISQAADSLIKGQEKDDQVWELLNDVFTKLSSSKSELIYYYFLWNLLAVLGYQIDLFNCAFCQKKLKPEKLYFSQENGIICSFCFKGQGKEISPEAIKILRILLQKDWPNVLRLKIGKEHKQELEKISENYLACWA